MMPDNQPGGDHSIEHIHIWYKSVTAMRRRVFDRLRGKPANFVDPLTQLELFGPEFSAPIEMVYPHSTNSLFPGSQSIDLEFMRLPRAFMERIKVTGENRAQGMSIKPGIYERVYYASTLFKGETPCTEQELKSWSLMSSFFKPFLKTILYSHDPHVVVGRMSKMIVDSLVNSKLDVRFVDGSGHVFEAESPEAYFDFHGIETSACDLCSDGRQYRKDDLRSVSSLTLRMNERFRKLLDDEKDSIAGYLRERDWSEYRVCRRCFAKYFPDRAWQ
jgi:hypothetical protein